MKQCRIYNCSDRKGSPCCIECPVDDCMNRCLNHPERCKCCTDIELRKQGQRKDVYDHGRIIALRASGMTVLEIADNIGCSQSTVQYHLARERGKR